ncbi:MAG: UDP-2,3-diacylglucosamine diphosphatase LpxI [Planctomycetota bacterium]
MPEPLGLIAGNGRLPLYTARAMRDAGRRVVAVGLAGQYRDDLPPLCDTFRGVGVLRVGRWARALRRQGVSDAVMIGGVNKSRLMYMPMARRLLTMCPDWTTARLWYRVLRHDRRSQTVMTAIADALADAGVRLMDSTTYLPEHLADAGPMTRRRPTPGQLADIDFGWPTLMEMNRLEVGQAIAVRDRDVVAVEAIEGTDAMIARAGELTGSRKNDGTGWTLLKGAGPDKDLRFDVPTVGVATIERLAAAGAGCLAVDPGRVILLDKPAILAAADAANLAVYGVTPPGS